jgi:tricorn protease
MRHLFLALALLPAIALYAPTDEPAPKPAPKDEARLLRFPTIHGDKIVFGYAGDLYTVAAKGGVARRLTSHDGYEMFPHFSPDGKTVAFTGQYDGNTEIYTIPADGGEPKRLTFTATLGRDNVSDRMGPNNIVMGWTPDGKSVVFRSRMHSFNDFLGQLYTVPATGGLAEELPLPRGGFCSYSPDGSKLAYNRVFREFRTWKRYRGGMADDIWVYDFKTKKTAQMTTDPAQDIAPMWHGDTIYFVSDRTGKMNLYSMPAAGGKAKQLTEYTEFDIKFPTLGDKAIVYENGGYIIRFDLESQKAEKVSVRILEDRIGARNKLLDVSKSVTSYGLNPDGSRAVFVARGDVFTVPAKAGPTRDLTNSPGVHDRSADWSPDGKHIACVSDETGEDEIWLIDPKTGAKSQLTSEADTYKYSLVWSPDSKSILWSDKKNRLSIVDVATKKVTVVFTSKIWEMHDAVWSPDSKWVAYTRPASNGMNQIYLYSVADAKNHLVTEGWQSNGDPRFSGDGKYLFFTSERDFNPIYSATEWNHAYRDMSRVYVAVLAKDTPSPFRPLDESEGEKLKKPAEDKGKEKEKPKEAVTKIDLDGISDRILRLPVKPGNYRNLHSVGSTVYYIRGSSGEPKPTLAMFDLATKKETVLGNAGGFDLSADGKKMIVSQEGKYGIIDLPKGPITITPLDLSGMEVKLDRAAEWKQIYRECWRQMRDFFYDEKMHGVDWKAMRDRYEPLVAHVAHRADLSYVIGEMIAELNVGHAYVGGGDMVHPARVPLGLLGARLRKDPKTGFVEIVKILEGNRWDPALRSPLRELGVDAKAGDLIVAIDGKPMDKMTNPYEALVNKVGKQVTLTLTRRDDMKTKRQVLVVPIADESALAYHDWVEGNLKRVSEATDGRVGYLHVPDMQQKGLNEFAKYFYPQVRKKALVIDMRGNGGGNVSPMLIERLRREIAMITISRNSSPRTDPPAMLYGPMVCLLNEFSASDGDLFPFRFRQHKLGKLIGKRSWGGVVGIRGTLPLLDGGTLNRPEFSRYDTEGKKWVIEGYGVDPDIVVDNDPAREYAGTDDQLERAIAEVVKELKAGEAEGKWKIPPPPASPKK